MCAKCQAFLQSHWPAAPRTDTRACLPAYRVPTPPNSKHLCIGGIYVRLLLEGPGGGGTAGTAAVVAGIIERLPAPKDFFAAAHHRLLCLGDTSLLLGPVSTSIPIASSSTGISGSQREWEAEADRELCLRAMTAVYHVHAGAIGPVEGIPHLLALLDTTASRSLRRVEASVVLTACPGIGTKMGKMGAVYRCPAALLFLFPGTPDSSCPPHTHVPAWLPTRPSTVCSPVHCLLAGSTCFCSWRRSSPPQSSPRAPPTAAPPTVPALLAPAPAGRRRCGQRTLMGWLCWRHGACP